MPERFLRNWFSEECNILTYRVLKAATESTAEACAVSEHGA